MLLPSPFESLRLPQKFVSLLGPPQQARFLQMTCLKQETLTVQEEVIRLEEEEPVNHLLVHCLWVSLLWDFSAPLMGVS